MKGTMTDNNSLPRPDRRLPKLRALVIEAPVAKREGDPMPGGTQQIADDPFSALSGANQILTPPYNLFSLATLPEYSTELTPCLDAMEQNIDGFGHRLIPRINIQGGDASTELVEKVMAERIRLDNFFAYAGLTDSFKEIRRKRRRDLECTGNAFWEVVPNAAGGISYFASMKSYQVRLTPQDATSIEVNMPVLEKQLDGGFEIKTIKVARRFRRFVQASMTVRSGDIVTGYRTSWFKEFGDPRVLDVQTGEYVSEERQRNFDGMGHAMPPERQAHEVVFWPLNATRSPYGLPRFVGCILSMYGDRRSAEVNYVTLCNNNVPSHVIAVSNGQLTEDTVDRIKEFLEGLQGDDNRSKILVIEAESVGEEGEDSGHVKVDIKPLTESQIKDAMYQEYSKSNRESVRVSFRLPPVFVGRADEYNRATAETSRVLADEQIFAPERDDFDDWMNRILFPRMGVLYHRYQSNSPNTTDNTELVSILGGAEKTGGMTPRIARWLLEDILSRELPDFPPEFNPDVPFSLTMAEAVKNLEVEPVQQSTAIKRLQRLVDLVGEKAGGGYMVQTLLDLRKQLEAEWSREQCGDEDNAGKSVEEG